MWASIGAAIWGVLGPYIMPILAAFAGERYRAQLDRIKQLEAENACKDQQNTNLTAAISASSDIIGMSKQSALDELERRGVQDVSNKPRKKR